MIIKEEKIVNWFKKNWILIGILTFTIAIRIYYFVLTRGQTLWWDSAVYMNIARRFAFGIDYTFNPVRPILFSLINSFFLRIADNEFLPRLFMLFLSVASVFGVYLLGKELYNKKVGLVASFLTSIFYLNLFFTYRLLQDMPSLTFFVFSGFLFYKYFKTKSNKALYLATGLIVIGTLLKLSTGFILPAILIYALITEGFKIFKRKEIWIAILIFVLLIAPYIIWGYFEFGGFIFTKAVSQVAPTDYSGGFGIMKTYLTLFPTYFSWILLATFILGIVLMYKTFLYFDKLIKGDEKLKRNLFLLLILIIPFVLISFFIGHSENRYLMTIFPTIFLISSSFIIFAYDLIRKKIKIVAVIFLIGLLVFVTIFQLQAADSLIKNKKGTYVQVKEAGLWLKQNSNVSDIVATKSQPQIKYYSGRDTIGLLETKEEFESSITQNTKFFMPSIFENHPGWAYNYSMEKNLTIVYGSIDGENNPILLIYELK